MRPGPDDYRELDSQNDRHLKVVDGALIIKNIQKSHEGFYLCEASNGIGGISAVARLAVQGNLFNSLILEVIGNVWCSTTVHSISYSLLLAPPSFEIKKRTQTALISENTVLECEAKGEKPIGVQWNMSNRRLDANVDARFLIETF